MGTSNLLMEWTMAQFTNSFIFLWRKTELPEANDKLSDLCRLRLLLFCFHNTPISHLHPRSFPDCPSWDWCESSSTLYFIYFSSHRFSLIFLSHSNVSVIFNELLCFCTNPFCQVDSFDRNKAPPSKQCPSFGKKSFHLPHLLDSYLPDDQAQANSELNNKKWVNKHAWSPFRTLTKYLLTA